MGRVQETEARDGFGVHARERSYPALPDAQMQSDQVSEIGPIYVRANCPVCIDGHHNYFYKPLKCPHAPNSLSARVV